MVEQQLTLMCTQVDQGEKAVCSIRRAKYTQRHNHIRSAVIIRQDIMNESNPSVNSHASQAPIEEPILNQLPDLPEEVILNVLSHMERPDLLAFSCTARNMNRLAIQHLLGASNISRPASYCRLVLDVAPQETIDPLMVLLHSVHIKEIKDLSFYFTAFLYPDLAPPLLRSLRLLRNLTCASEVTLFFGSKGVSKEPRDGKHLKELIPIYEDLFNEMIIKSCNKIRVFGSTGFLGQFYEFRKLARTHSSPSSKILKGVKLRDYLDRRQSRNSDDPIVLDDLRYSRTSVTGSRIFLRCSPEALANTKLNHLNFGTADFLRPPFSQWIFTMLRASPIQSLSFAFSHLPSDPEEVEFILKRLASVLPHLNRLYLFDIEPDVLPILIRWINMFPSLRTLQIEPFVDLSDDKFSYLRLPPTSTVTTSVDPFTFASYLRRIDGPHQFLTYFFEACGPEGDKLKFPALDMVHLDYFCIKGVHFDLAILANALKRIKPAFTTPDFTLTTSIVVHLKFDRYFLGLTESICQGCIPDVEDVAEIGYVERLRLGLPGTKEEIMQGKFNDKILGCVTLFSGLKYLRLASTENATRPKEDMGSLHFQVFKARNSGLKRVELL